MIESIENLIETAEAAMNQDDLICERDGVDLERAAGTHLRESIANCSSLHVLIGTHASIENAIGILQERKAEVEAKIASLSFVGRLVA